MRKYYKAPYGTSASIEVHRDGSATLRMWCGCKREVRRCASETSAKRVLSRWTDGLYEPAGDDQR